MKRHLIMVGLPGSGKSTVGKAAADQLGADFLDLDQAIERKQGMPVERMFAELGEPAFRQVEASTMASVLAGDPCVISPGGGWAAQPGEIEQAKARSFLVYLKAMVTTLVDRSKLTDAKPLLTGGDPYTLMRGLLEEREPFYLQADIEIENGTRPLDEVVQEVVAAARSQAGW
jgi:shikimate kinase